MKVPQLSPCLELATGDTSGCVCVLGLRTHPLSIRHGVRLLAAEFFVASAGQAVGGSVMPPMLRMSLYAADGPELPTTETVFVASSNPSFGMLASAFAGALLAVLVAVIAIALLLRMRRSLAAAQARCIQLATQGGDVSPGLLGETCEASPFVVDIQAAEDAVAAVSRAKQDFLSSMSHEIRTPLNAIIGFADLIGIDPDLSPMTRRHVEWIKAGGAAVLTMVNDILDFSQIESGALRLDLRPFVLPRLVDECVALIDEAACARNLILHVAIDNVVPAGVLGDATRLRQILLNILNNAIKFTPAGLVTLRVCCGSVAGRILFEIEDTGIGIDAADMPLVFERFRQVDGTIRRTYGGSGLGLAISKRLVEAMGGTIGVRSEPGVGSTFWFWLDLPATRPTPEPAKWSKPANQARPLRVLLAEDVRLNQELVIAVLEALGHSVDIVGDGAAAIMAVDHGRYDLVLMDLQMPHVDGVTATRAIRRLPHAGRLVPIVALSANVLPAQVEAALAAGMDDFLAKPLTLEPIGALMDLVGRGDLRTRSDHAVHDADALAKLTAIVGEAKVRSMLATLETLLLSRFERPLAPETVPTLKAEAHAAISGSAILGFKPFAALCRRFIEAELEADLERLQAELLRELICVVRLAGTMARGGDVSALRAA